MLDLFEKVEVRKVDRLNTEDLQELKNRQEAFNNAKEVYYQLEAIVNSIEDKNVTDYLNFTSLRDDIRERLQNATKSFITDIYWHFTSKYKIELSYDKMWNEDIFRWKWTNNHNSWEEAMQYVESMNYEKILDDIYSQTGTLNFADKGKEEFLDKCKKQIGYKMEHKNNNVSFNALVIQSRYNLNEISSYSEENMQMMFKAINLFENNNYKLSTWAENFCRNCRNNYKKDNFNTFSTHTNLPFADIEHIKIFKNGKVELKFTNYELAEKFYNMFYRKG